MRVLWFTNTPSNYSPVGGYNGGGWISSLEKELSKRNDINLGISFFMKGQPPKSEHNGVTYYPISDIYSGSLFKKVRGALTCSENKDTERTKIFLKVISDFKPDIIEVSGSEQGFGLVSQFVHIPIALHIQGILTPYATAFLPPFISLYNYIWEDCNPWCAFKRYKGYKSFCRNGARERRIISSVNNFIGRTEWDKRITKLYHPNARYFYGGEILRNIFYEQKERTLPEKVTFVTTISSPLYKGYDVVLKTAKLLKERDNFNFVWQIYGNINPHYIERKTGIRHEDVNVIFMGVATAKQLRDALLQATAYLHLSYIDNSPNSLCEAQILGLPVIATNVGGVSSLIKEGETGFLVPANDPYQTAYLAIKLSSDLSLNVGIGKRAQFVARQRHDKQSIVKGLVNIYHKILNEERDH